MSVITLDEPAVTALDAVAVPAAEAPVARRLKRLMDLALGVPLLLAALPVMALLALIVFVIDPGMPFYGQERSGQHGRRIRVWKIRSMYHDAEARLAPLLASDPALAAEWARSFKLRRDPRVLPLIGRFMRCHSLDELPQLLNVMTGSLSLVGPRVFADYDLALYSPRQLKIRQSVRPGVTGLWQVAARHEGDNRDKIRYDLAYVRDWSLAMDLAILARTIGVVLTGHGGC